MYGVCVCGVYVGLSLVVCNSTPVHLSRTAVTRRIATLGRRATRGTTGTHLLRAEYRDIASTTEHPVFIPF